MLEKSKIKSFIEDLEIELDNIEGTDRNSLEIRNLLSNAIEAGKTYDSYFTSSNARKFESAVEACEEKLGRKIARNEPYDFDDEDVDDLITEYEATLESVSNVFDEEKSKGRLTGLAKDEGEGFYNACTKTIKAVIAALKEYKNNPNSKNAKKVTKVITEYRKVAENILAFYNNREKNDKYSPKTLWGKIKANALNKDPKQSLKNMGGCLRWGFYLFAAALIVDQFLTVSPFIAAFVSVGTTIGIAGCGLGLIYNGGKFIINKAVKGKDYVVGRDPLAIKRKLANALEENKGKGKDAKAVTKKVPKASVTEAEKEKKTQKEKHDSFFILLEDCLKGVLFEESGRIKISSERIRIVRDLLSKKSEYFVNDDELRGNETVAKLSLIMDFYDKLRVIPNTSKEIIEVMDQSVIKQCLSTFKQFFKLDIVVNGSLLSEKAKIDMIGKERFETLNIACAYKFVAIMDKINNTNKCTESDYYEASNLYANLEPEQKTRYARRCELFEKISQLYELGSFLEMSEEDMKELSTAELKKMDAFGSSILGYFMSSSDGEEFVRSVIPRAVSKFEKFNRVLELRGISEESKPAEERKPIIEEKPAHTNPRERENEQAGMEQGGEAKPAEEKPTEQAKPKAKRKKSVRDTLPRVQADYSTFKSEQLAEVYRSALKEMEIAHDDMDSIEFRRGLSKALKIFDYASKNSLMAMFNADDVKKVKEFYDEYKTYVSGKIK